VTIVRRIALNAASVLTSDVAVRAGTFVLYALVARHLGPAEFGQLSLALAFFYPSQVVAIAGLKPLLIREVAKDPDAAAPYFVNASAIVLAMSAVSFAAVTGIVYILGYPRSSALAILTLSLGLLPFSLSKVTESIFQARDQMYFVPWVQIAANLLKVGLGFVMLNAGRGLMAVIVVINAAYVFTMIVEWLILFRQITVPTVRPRIDAMRTLVKTTMPLLGTSGLLAMVTSAPIVILSQFVSQRQVGVFGAAMQLTTPLGLIITSVMLSFFPLMSRRFDRGLRSLSQVTKMLTGLLVAVLAPAMAALAYVAEPLVLLLYGEPAFAQSADIFRIFLLATLFSASTRVFGQTLVAANHERSEFKIHLVTATLTLVVGVAMMSTYGTLGGAVSIVVVQIVAFFMHYRSASRFLPDLALGRMVWTKIVATACMGGVLLGIGTEALLLGLCAGLIVYLAALLGLEILAAGGVAQVKAKYEFIWSG
jgi:O-antigen/teichoic acid export membrane protein